MVTRHATAGYAGTVFARRKSARRSNIPDTRCYLMVLFCHGAPCRFGGRAWGRFQTAPIHPLSGTATLMGRMTVIRGDITRLAVDAIVNAANEALLPGGGVCGAIHRAAGPGLWEECKRIGHCPPGEAVITGGYALPARYVIHTVGPIWRGGGHGEDETLARCYASSLRLAAEHGIRSIAFPAISTGIYGFPADRAARIAVEAVRRYLHEHEQPTDVRFVVFDDANIAAYAAALPASVEEVVREA